jgi:hypothetical protein
VITIVLIFLAGICNAMMDVLEFRYDTSIFSFWNNQLWVNPTYSWVNKWKWDGDRKIGERFLGSSTVFVFLTDLWHLSKFLMLVLLMGGAVFYHPIINWWLDLLLIYSIFTVTFELFFSKIFIKKD